MTDQELIESASKNATTILNIDYSKVSDHLSLVRIYFGLSHLFGGDEDLMRHWVNTHNNHLGYSPIEGIETNKTSDVLTYLEGNLFV